METDKWVNVKNIVTQHENGLSRSREKSGFTLTIVCIFAMVVTSSVAVNC